MCVCLAPCKLCSTPSRCQLKSTRMGQHGGTGMSWRSPLLVALLGSWGVIAERGDESREHGGQPRRPGPPGASGRVGRVSRWAEPLAAAAATSHMCRPSEQLLRVNPRAQSTRGQQGNMHCGVGSLKSSSSRMCTGWRCSGAPPLATATATCPRHVYQAVPAGLPPGPPTRPSRPSPMHVLQRPKATCGEWCVSCGPFTRVLWSTDRAVAAPTQILSPSPHFHLPSRRRH